MNQLLVQLIGQRVQIATDNGLEISVDNGRARPLILFDFG